MIYLLLHSYSLSFLLYLHRHWFSWLLFHFLPGQLSLTPKSLILNSPVTNRLTLSTHHLFRGQTWSTFLIIRLSKNFFCKLSSKLQDATFTVYFSTHLCYLEYPLLRIHCLLSIGLQVPSSWTCISAVISCCSKFVCTCKNCLLWKFLWWFQYLLPSSNHSRLTTLYLNWEFIYLLKIKFLGTRSINKTPKSGLESYIDDHWICTWITFL